MKNAFLMSVATLCLLNSPKMKASEDYIEGEELDISGSFTRKPKATPADRMKALREKLEHQNEQMVQKKIESARMKNELALMRKLQKTFDENMKKLDSIQ